MLPCSFTIGDQVSWDDYNVKDLLGGDVDSTAWTLTYAFRGPTAFDVIGTPSTTTGSSWNLTIDSVLSATLTEGTYYYQSVITDSTLGIRQTISSGEIKVCASLADVTAPYDGRSQVEKDLAAVQLSMRNIIAGGAAIEYTIGSRHLRRMDLSDLMVLESHLKYQLAREKRSQSISRGLGSPNSLYIRFK